jgi:hypothetical protein
VDHLLDLLNGARRTACGAWRFRDVEPGIGGRRICASCEAIVAETELLSSHQQTKQR